MRLYDNFLESYSTLKKHSLSCEFKDVSNPYDGVLYPLICEDIPEQVEVEIRQKLEYIKGSPLEQFVIFMRQSPSGISCPHPVHHDKSMGDYSFMLYLNDINNGGTGIFRHKATGITYAPENQEYARILQDDTKNIEAWVEYDRVPMKENRAVIFDAGQLHAALPFGGAGKGKDARTVLTVFFT